MNNHESTSIAVLYSCPLCALIDVKVSVKAREPAEDVLVWMDNVIATVSNDHAHRSPDCHPDELKNVKIPTAGADYIGGPMTLQ